jgi:hypothetical protein
MRLLSAHDIVRICEWGRDKHALDRALVLLRAAAPERDPEELARLPIGRRDALLLMLREQTFGPRLDLGVKCPKCGKALELGMTCAQLTIPVGPYSGSSVLCHDGYEIRYRLPDSFDLASIVGVQDPLEARNRLLSRCVMEVRREQEPAPLAEVTEAVLSALSARLAEEDPQADVAFRMTCPACSHPWRAILDIFSFFWAELEAYARRLQQDVHGLAKAYGWSEAQILSLSAGRRMRYLEMASRG